jgi:hypothetical protein
LVAGRFIDEDAIVLGIDECSLVNKVEVIRLLDRLAAFEGVGDVDVGLLESRHFKCVCGACVKRREQERGDRFVQPAYWFAALLLRLGVDVDEVVEMCKKEGWFGEWDERHEVYSPNERLNDGGFVDGGLEEEVESDRDFFEGGGLGGLFGDGAVEDESIEGIEELITDEPSGGIHTPISNNTSTDIEDDTPVPQSPSHPEDGRGGPQVHTLTQPPFHLSRTLEPCPEHCPSRRKRIRDNIHNPNHPSCTYHCHHGHSAWEFDRSGEQVGFWLPHGIKNKKAWAKGVVKRLVGLGEAYEMFFGEGSCGVVREALECVGELAGMVK